MPPDSDGRPEPLILNVNDSEGARFLVTLILQKAGLQVIEAETGQAALEALGRRKPPGFDVHLVKPVDAPRLSALLSQHARADQTPRARSLA